MNAQMNQTKRISSFAFLQREVDNIQSNSQYSELKRIDQKIRNAYMRDQISGREFNVLIQDLWRK